MISVSFVKTIKCLLNELKKEDKLYQYVYSTILLNAEEGEYLFDLDYSEFSKVFDMLDYDGFDIDIICQTGDIVTFIVKW